MLHKIIDFTQTILGTVALTGIIALSVITVNALNPSVKASDPEDAKVAGLSTHPKDSNALPVQFTDSLKSSAFDGNLSYVSDNKSVFKLQVTNLTQVQEMDFLSIENLNNFATNYNVSVYIPNQLTNSLKVELVDNVNQYELKQTSKSLNLKSLEQKLVKLKLTPLININFPFELEFEITQ